MSIWENLTGLTFASTSRPIPPCAESLFSWYRRISLQKNSCRVQAQTALLPNLSIWKICYCALLLVSQHEHFKTYQLAQLLFNLSHVQSFGRCCEASSIDVQYNRGSQ